MTAIQSNPLQKRKAPRLSTGRFLLGLCSLLCLVLFLLDSEAALDYMKKGLHLCANTVIPSLFPFTVIAEILLSLGVGRLLIRPLAPLLRRLFRLSEEGASAVLLGLLCGFPIGAHCLMHALDEGRITQEEASRALLFCNTPSSSFLINVVGVSLWGNRWLGLSLYLTVLLSQILTGWIASRFAKVDADTIPQKMPSDTSPVALSQVFTNAVRSSCFSMLLICAYVVFFSALMGMLMTLLRRLGVDGAWQAWLFCLLELSGGMNAASALSSPIPAACLCAFCAGWSGLSVHCQLQSLCDGRALSFRPYLLTKLAQGLFCAAVLWLLLQLIPDLLLPLQAPSAPSAVTLWPIPLGTLLFVGGLVFCLAGKLGRPRS